MTLEEAAAKLDLTRTSLHRVEKGETHANVHLLRSMMDIYDQRDDSLLDLSRKAKRKGWWLDFGLKGTGYLELETEASAVRTWQLAFVPGLLQDEDYMRTLFRSMGTYTEQKRENEIKARLYRRRRLHDTETPIRLHAIIDESVLRRPIGGPEVMRAQLHHLIACAELPTVTLQVMPYGIESHQGMDGAFVILSFDGPGGPDLLYQENAAGQTRNEKPEEVKAVSEVFDRLRAAALSPDDAVAFIEKEIVELEQTARSWA